MTTIPYHLGVDDAFSLDYVTPEVDRFYHQLSQYTPPTRVVTTRFNTLERPVYLVYTTRPISGGDVTIPDHPFVSAMVRAFAGIVDGRRDQGSTVCGNKSVRLDDIPVVLSDRIEWQQPVTAVGGQLLSNLILTHALPNANHRTSLSMLLIYLQSVGVDVSGEDLVDSGVDEYIQKSKRLLTIRRNATKFRILEDCGGDTVERKGGIQIDLGAYDLTVSDPYTTYARKHEEHSTQFVERLIDEDWRTVDDSGLRTFLDRL